MKRLSKPVQRLVHHHFFLTLLLSVLVLAFLQGCTTTKKYNDVAEKLEQAEAENKILTTQLVRQTKGSEIVHSLYEDLVVELEDEVKTNQIVIEEMVSGVHVILSEKVLFSSGATDLKEPGHQMLLKMGKDLKEVPFQILVIGFTDNVPVGTQLVQNYPSNWELAGARAARVVRVLEEAGVHKEQLRAVSLAENMPIASNDTPEGRTKNRRVEIRLRPVVVVEN